MWIGVGEGAITFAVISGQYPFIIQYLCIECSWGCRSGPAGLGLQSPRQEGRPVPCCVGPPPPPPTSLPPCRGLLALEAALNTGICLRSPGRHRKTLTGKSIVTLMLKIL